MSPALPAIDLSALLATLAGAAPVGLFLADASGECRWVNDRLCELAGRSPGDLVHGPWSRGIHEEDRARVTGEWAAAARRGSDFRSEFRVRRADGSLRWVLAHAAGDAHGAWLGSVTDISHLREARQRAEQSEATLLTALDAFPGIAHVVVRRAPGDFAFEYVNRGFLAVTGLRTGAVIGRRPSGLLGEAGLEMEACFERAVAGGTRAAVLTTPWPMTAAEMEVTITPVFQGGEHARVVVFARDVTAERAAHARDARHAQVDRLAQAASGISNEFNQALTTISGNLAIARIETPGIAQDLYDAIEQAVSRANQAARRLLQASGGATARWQFASVSQVLVTALGRLGALDRVRLELEPGIPRILGDQEELAEALGAVIENAIETGADVAVRARASTIDAAAIGDAFHPMPVGPGRYVEIRVTDRGQGMDARELEQAFYLYYSTKSPRRGTGLPAALGIVRAHGGAIFARSTPGAGSEFTLLLPPAA